MREKLFTLMNRKPSETLSLPQQALLDLLATESVATRDDLLDAVSQSLPTCDDKAVAEAFTELLKDGLVAEVEDLSDLRFQQWDDGWGDYEWASPIHSRGRRLPVRTKLVFCSGPWMKLNYLCRLGDTEIGGLAIVDPKEPLRVIDFRLITQEAYPAYVSLDGDGLQDHIFQALQEGYEPAQSYRVWIHTHPGNCPQPSGTDEETFHKEFGECDWAIMFILAEGGKTSCRMRHQATQYEVDLGVEVDWSDRGLTRIDDEVWVQEYKDKVTVCDRAVRKPPAQTAPPKVTGKAKDQPSSKVKDKTKATDPPPSDEAPRRLVQTPNKFALGRHRGGG